MALVRRDVALVSVVTLTLAFAVSGCGEIPGPSTQEEAALRPPSRAVNVQTFTCGWVGPEAHPEASCSVPPEFVLVGGGAETCLALASDGSCAVRNSSSIDTGALLTASYPLDSGLTTWRANSKDHINPTQHYLRASAIGISMSGVSAATLRQQMSYVKETGAFANHPTATARAPGGMLVLGGGAKANYGWYGQLLTKSWPLVENEQTVGWEVASKDHGVADPGTIEAYVISINPCIPLFGCLQTSRQTINSNEFVPAVSIQTGFTPRELPQINSATCAGGRTTTAEGLPLTQLYKGTWPEVGMLVFVAGKQHVYPVSGSAEISVATIVLSGAL